MTKYKIIDQKLYNLVIKMNFTAIIINRQARFLFSQQSRKKYFFKVKEGHQVQQNQILPSQYPKDLTDTESPVHRGRPIRYITPKHEIPEDKFIQNADLVKAQKYNGKWKSPQNAYALNVGLIGPVNSGKSELMGKIIGRKLSAVSPKANTTKQTIQVYKSYQIQSQISGLKNIQLKFYDTAGMMYKKTGFISKGWKVLSEIDFSLLVIDSTKRFDQMTKQSIKRLETHRNYENFMKALVLNKIDLVQNRKKFHSLIGQVEKYGKFDKIFYVSAITGNGIQQLESYLLKHAKARQWSQPKQVITNLTEVQIFQEMMKESLYHRCYKQVPHNCTIQCIAISLKSNGIQELRFKFTVESENQQRMILGTKGKNVNWIIDRFKVYYAEAYKKSCEVYVEVRIRKKTNQPFFLQQQNSFDEQTQKRFQKQKIVAVEEYLHAQGKFREQSMMKWNNFLNEQDQESNKSKKLSQTREVRQLESKTQSKFKKKRRLKRYVNNFKRR